MIVIVVKVVKRAAIKVLKKVVKKIVKKVVAKVKRVQLTVVPIKSVVTIVSIMTNIA